MLYGLPLSDNWSCACLAALLLVLLMQVLGCVKVRLSVCVGYWLLD
jgi:hypothetical protein